MALEERDYICKGVKEDLTKMVTIMERPNNGEGVHQEYIKGFPLVSQVEKRISTMS